MASLSKMSLVCILAMFVGLACKTQMPGVGEIQSHARSATIQMRDGTTQVGTPIETVFPANVGHAARVMAMDNIARILFSSRDAANVQENNGIVVSCHPRFRSMAFATTNGLFRADIADIRSICFETDLPMPDLSVKNDHRTKSKNNEPRIHAPKKNGLIFSCSMDSNEDIAAAGGVFHDLTYVDGVVGKAVRIPAGRQEIVFDIPEFAEKYDEFRGCMEFWARLGNPADIEGDGRGSMPFAFIRPRNDSFRITAFIMFTHNDGLGHGGLCGRIFSNPNASTHNFGTPFRIEEIVGGNPAEWHKYTLAWDVNGFGPEKHVIEIKVDGKLVCSTSVPCPQATKVDVMPPQAIHLADFCPDQHPEAFFDELKVWNVPDPSTDKD